MAGKMDVTNALLATLVLIVAGGVVATFAGFGPLSVGDDPELEDDDIVDGQIDITQFPIDVQFNFPDATDAEVTTQLATEEPEEADFGNYVDWDADAADVDLQERIDANGESVTYEAWDTPGTVYVAAEAAGHHNGFIEYDVDQMQNERYFSEDTPLRVNDFRDNLDKEPVFETGSVTVSDADGEPTAIEADHTNAAVGAEDDAATVTHTVDEGVAYLGEVDVAVSDEDEVDVEVFVDGSSVYAETVDDEGDDAELTEDMETDPLHADSEIEIVVEGMEDEQPEVMVEVHNIYEEVDAVLGINQGA